MTEAPKTYLVMGGVAADSRELCFVITKALDCEFLTSDGSLCMEPLSGAIIEFRGPHGSLSS